MKVNHQVESLANQTFLEKLHSLDFDLIAKKLMHSEHSQGWTQEQVERAISRYKMFLYLIYLYPNSSITPTPEIDRVWHQHILDTRKYARDCQWLFGYFVHHSPGSCMENEVDKLTLSTAFSRTIALFAEHFSIDLTEDMYDAKNACVIIAKGQLHQTSVCLKIM